MRSEHIISEKEFLQAYDDHADSVFRHCYLRTANREESKSAMRDSFKQLWLFIARGNFVDSIKIFLFREANTLLRQRALESTQNENLETLPEELTSVLTRLAFDQRPAFLLHYIDGFNCDDISEILGGTVEAHSENLSRIRNKVAHLSNVV